jgi:hypothetical protein
VKRRNFLLGGATKPAKNFSGFMSQMRPTRLRLALQAQPSILHAKRAAVVATMSKMRRVMPRCGAYCA